MKLLLPSSRWVNLTVMPLSDFDFLIGRWTVRIRALSEPAWCEFEASYDCRRIGQLGNVAYVRTCAGAFPMEGVSIRLYNPARDEWTLTWTDSSRPGILQPPLTGSFTGSRGVFYGDTSHEGRAMRVRIVWRKAPHPHFEQSFSSNNGRTWQANWMMSLEAKPRSAVFQPTTPSFTSRPESASALPTHSPSPAPAP